MEKKRTEKKRRNNGKETEKKKKKTCETKSVWMNVWWNEKMKRWSGMKVNWLWEGGGCWRGEGKGWWSKGVCNRTSSMLISETCNCYILSHVKSTCNHDNLNYPQMANMPMWYLPRGLAFLANVACLVHDVVKQWYLIVSVDIHNYSTLLPMLVWEISLILSERAMGSLPSLFHDISFSAQFRHFVSSLDCRHGNMVKQRNNNRKKRPSAEEGKKMTAMVKNKVQKVVMVVISYEEWTMLKAHETRRFCTTHDHVTSLAVHTRIHHQRMRANTNKATANPQNDNDISIWTLKFIWMQFLVSTVSVFYLSRFQYSYRKYGSNEHAFNENLSVKK